MRELENSIESLVALSFDNELDLTLLPRCEPAGNGSSARRATLKDRVEAYERGLLVATLQQTEGNRSEAARLLGVGRTTLHEKLRKYGIES